jgi:hypothetical protein
VDRVRVGVSTRTISTCFLFTQSRRSCVDLEFGEMIVRIYQFNIYSMDRLAGVNL